MYYATCNTVYISTSICKERWRYPKVCICIDQTQSFTQFNQEKKIGSHVTELKIWLENIAQFNAQNKNEFNR